MGKKEKSEGRRKIAREDVEGEERRKGSWSGSRERVERGEIAPRRRVDTVTAKGERKSGGRSENSGARRYFQVHF